VVATPNPSHFEVAKQCLLAGREVVVDKPFTVTSQQARELIQLAKQRKRLLTAFQNRRWDGDFKTIRRLVDSRVMGQIVEYEARYDRFRPNPKANAWREREEPGSGVLHDLGSHLIDQALVLFGPPKSITAAVLCQREWSKVNDAFDIRLEYPRLRATLRASMLACAPGPHFVIHGTKGSFIKYGMDPQEDVLRGGKMPEGTDWGPHWGEEPESQWGTLSVMNGESRSDQKIETENGDYRGFYENVRDAILPGSALEVMPEQAFRTIRAIELALESSREQRTVPWSETAN